MDERGLTHWLKVLGILALSIGLIVAGVESPLVVIAMILIFTALFGVVETFVAVPVAAMLRVLKLHFAAAAPPAEMAVQERRAAALRVL